MRRQSIQERSRRKGETKKRKKQENRTREEDHQDKIIKRYIRTLYKRTDEGEPTKDIICMPESRLHAKSQSGVD